MRTQKKKRAWYAREKTWPGKVHRSKNVMARVATLLRAKRKRRQKILSTPKARAAMKKAIYAHKGRVMQAHAHRQQVVNAV